MKLAVVGGGIAGLAAAWELSGGPEAADQVTVFEPGLLGGRIRTEDFLGHRVDAGADAFIARVPDAVALAGEVGLAEELVAPAVRRALVLVGGRLHPLPDGLVLGAPARLAPLITSGILSPRGILRAALDLVLPRTGWPSDMSVAEVVGRRFGAQVVDRLVEPLIGGIHAGSTWDLSVEATAPQLARAARSHRSLLAGLRTLPPPAPGPLFLAPQGGMGQLVDRLVEALRGRGVRFEPVAVSRLGREKGGRVAVEPGGSFDGAVVATPGPVTARLVNDAAPAAAGELGAIRWSSVVLATLAYRHADMALPEGTSGWLVAREEATLMTACSFGSAKWPHWADPDVVVLRVSAGRTGDERVWSLTDAEVVDRLQHEVAGPLAASAAPFQWRLSRWREAFPQYEVGHGERVERIESALDQDLPGVALAGATLRGSGIPACVASGRRAARALRARRFGT